MNRTETSHGARLCKRAAQDVVSNDVSSGAMPPTSSLRRPELQTPPSSRTLRPRRLQMPTGGLRGGPGAASVNPRLPAQFNHGTLRLSSY